MRQHAAKIVGHGLSVGQRHLDLGARLGLLIALRPLVRNPVAGTDASHAQRLIGAGEIAVGSVEVVVRLLPRRLWASAPGLEALPPRREIRYPTLHFDFAHLVSSF